MMNWGPQASGGGRDQGSTKIRQITGLLLEKLTNNKLNVVIFDNFPVKHAQMHRWFIRAGKIIQEQEENIRTYGN